MEKSGAQLAEHVRTVMCVDIRWAILIITFLLFDSNQAWKIKNQIKATTVFQFESVFLYNPIFYARNSGNVGKRRSDSATSNADLSISQLYANYEWWCKVKIQTICSNHTAHLVRRFFSSRLTTYPKFDVQKYIRGHLVVYDVSLLCEITQKEITCASGKCT